MAAFSGLSRGRGTLALGHNHPVVVEAILAHLAAELPLQTLDLGSPLRDEFITELFASLPPELARDARIQFCGPTGSDGIEAAIKLVKIATGRSAMVAFRGAYHGTERLAEPYGQYRAEERREFDGGRSLHAFPERVPVALRSAPLHGLPMRGVSRNGADRS